MGGSFGDTEEYVGEIDCQGGDVLSNLNDVFGNPHSDAYKYAQANNSFGDIQNTEGNYRDLIRAYQNARVPMSSGWVKYLKLLGTLSVDGPAQGPTNIWQIAQMRYTCLIRGKKMKTDVHKPQHGGHVHILDDTINSPCPLPGE